MARDYRYGHKSSTPTPRRTQQGEEAQAFDSRSADKPVKPFSSIIRKKNKRQLSSSASNTQKLNLVEINEVSSELKSSRDTSHTPYRQAKIESSSVQAAVDDVQKVKNKAYRDSLPNHIRKELEAQEALAKAQAEQAERDHLAQLTIQKEKRRHRLSLGAWLSIAGLTLIGIAWLLYAPFFLAFAFEMGWVSEETRNRLDPAASIRSELASKSIEPVKKSASRAADKPVEDANAVQYTFYGELPKNVVLAGVQPLAVKTKAPMYLQLLSVPNVDQAQAERRRLMQKGYVVNMATLAGKSGTNYVLRMGPYDDQRTLNRLKVELQKLGIDAREVSLANVVKASEPVKTSINPANKPHNPPANNTRGAVAPR
jgi:hypothetical protein